VNANAVTIRPSANNPGNVLACDPNFIAQEYTGSSRVGPGSFALFAINGFI
jgi:hypothetical protein